MPLYPVELSHKGPKIAMILLLGPEEREFRLTEAHVRPWIVYLAR